MDAQAGEVVRSFHGDAQLIPTLTRAALLVGGLLALALSLALLRFYRFRMTKLMREDVSSAQHQFAGAAMRHTEPAPSTPDAQQYICRYLMAARWRLALRYLV